MAVERLLMKKSANGMIIPFSRTKPGYVDARVLGAGVAETVTVPAGADILIFSCTDNFYAKPGASAAVPGADVTDGSASELNPTQWLVAPADQVTVIAPANCVLTLSYYKGNA